jgi:hypothetical protein
MAYRLKFQLTTSVIHWRPKFDCEADLTWVTYNKTVDGAQLRDKQGKMLSGSLPLQIRDFAPQADLDRLYPGAELDE